MRGRCVQLFITLPLNLRFMKPVLSVLALILFIFCLGGCTSDNITGVYVCDQSQKKPDSTIQRQYNVEHFVDLTCTIQELDFKGNSTVELKLPNGPLVTSYVTEKGYIRVKGSGSDILFKIKDDRTLSGEGIAQGLYHKK
jgi:hypothetical protein